MKIVNRVKIALIVLGFGFLVNFYLIVIIQDGVRGLINSPYPLGLIALIIISIIYWPKKGREPRS